MLSDIQPGVKFTNGFDGMLEKGCIDHNVRACMQGNGTQALKG